MFCKASSSYFKISCTRNFGRLVRSSCLQTRYLSDQRNALSKGNKNLKFITDNWISKLRNCGVPEPELSVKYIVEKALAKPGMTRKTVKMMNNKQISSVQENNINNMCSQRLKREPIQYIIGDWDFRHMTLITKPPVFIPRSETEELVDFFTSYHLTNAHSKFTFLEVGCGSGAISLSILLEHSKVSCVAIDSNPHAVALTKLNAERYGLENRIAVINAEIGNFCCNTKFDAIVSNPPYIPRQDMDCLEPEVKRYEDHSALCGGEDGMDVIQTILAAAPRLLKPYGSIWLEMDLSHPPLVRQWLQDHPSLGMKLNKLYKDFTNR